VDFGQTPLGTPVARQFLISNPNGTPFTVTTINVPSGYQRTNGTGPNLVASGGTLIFEVTLLANTTGGTKSGNVVINSDAPGMGTFIFPITGVVLAPPTVTTLAATGNSGGNATLNATVNPQGSATDVWFQWSLTGQFDGVLVSTVAGSSPGFAEGIGSTAEFNQPYGMAIDAGGIPSSLTRRTIAFAGSRRTGTVTVFAGTGTPGFADGAGATAQFNEPTGVAFGSAGTLFVCDSLNHRIRAITPGGVVSTYAGLLGEAGFTDGVASAARFSTPWGLAIDADDVILRRGPREPSHPQSRGGRLGEHAGGHGHPRHRPTARAMSCSSTSRWGSPWTQGRCLRDRDDESCHSQDRAGRHHQHFRRPGRHAQLINGTAAAARFSSPVGLAVDLGGSIFVADKGNHSIRRISSTIGAGGVVALNVVTFAGLGTSGTRMD
jgi:hypothetical protein